MSLQHLTDNGSKIRMAMFKDLGLGILSWKAHETLRGSLTSYQNTADFLDLFGKRLIFFSDILEADRELAREFGWQVNGGVNQGIAGGMKRLAESLDTPYVILLQNDNPLVVGTEFAKKHLEGALELLRSEVAHVVRLQHRWRVGEGFCLVDRYCRYYPIRHASPEWQPEFHEVGPQGFPESTKKRFLRSLRPIKARRLVGSSIFIEESPEKFFPEDIHRTRTLSGEEFLVVRSRALEFSDQCVMMRRSFFLDVLMKYVDAHPSRSRTPNGFQAPEICLAGGWWRRKNFKVAQGTGLFTHCRIDGSFRPEHHAYEPKDAV